MMTKPVIYQGNWPQNISKSAKYSVRSDQNEWRVSVIMQHDEGKRTLFAEERHLELIEKVNFIKTSLGFSPGGTFYVNEYQHLLVPVSMNKTSVYYYGGKVNEDFRFCFDGDIYTSKPVSKSGSKLRAGDEWFGPRPGIPYTLESGAADIRYISIDFTRMNLAEIHRVYKIRLNLLNECKNERVVKENIKMISEVKGYAGGRFYVNEYRAVFSPVMSREDGWKYVYCGELKMDGWFPEPKLGNL